MWAADPRMFCSCGWEAQLTFPAALPGRVSTDARSEHRELAQHLSTREQMTSWQIFPPCMHTALPRSREKNPLTSEANILLKLKVSFLKEMEQLQNLYMDKAPSHPSTFPKDGSQHSCKHPTSRTPGWMLPVQHQHSCQEVQESLC